METVGFEAVERAMGDALAGLGAQAVLLVPRLVGAIVLLAVGWGIARIVAGLTMRITARAGLDRAASRLGVDATLGRAGLPRDGSAILGRLVFWTLMLTFGLSAAETLGLEAVAIAIDRLIAFLPDLMVAGVIAVLGMLLARLSGDAVVSAASAARMDFARALGQVVRGGLVCVVAVVALGQLGIDTTILLWGLITLVGSVSFALALAFALGSREVVRGILAGYYLRRSLLDRDDVLIDGRRGRLDRIGPVHSVFVSEDGSWFVPNAELLSMRIDRLPRH